MSLSRAASAHPHWRTGAWFAGAMLLGTLAAYQNAFRVPFVFDDLPALAAAARIVQAGGARALLEPGPDAGETTSGRPLVRLTLAVNHALSGEHPWSYHVTNLLIHYLAGLALLGAARRTLLLATVPAHLRRAALPVAAALAALWTLHPVQTQSVTYIAQRAESLAGLLFLFTLYLFIRSIDSPHARGWRALSVLACLLGMAAKEVMAAAPLIVLLHDRTFVAGTFREAWRRRSAYYLALAGTWVLLALLVASTEGRGGTAGFDTDVSAWHYLLTQCRAIAHYLRLAAWPQGLVFDYGTDVIRDVRAVIVPAAFLLLLAGATARGVWRGSATGFLGCFFFAALAPSSSIIPVASQTIAEHRIYLALAAPIALAVAALQTCLGRRSVFVWVSLAIACAGLTHRRNETYRSDLGLWADTVTKYPANARARHNLGLAHFKRGQIEAAVAHFETALRLRPDSADAHYNLGLCLVRLGRPADAIFHYEHALARQPQHAEAHNNLGNALLARGRLAEARTHYEHAARIKPTLAEAHGNLGNVLLQLGDPAQALRHCEAALRLKPNYADARYNAANVYAELRRFAEARANYEAALRLEPEHAGAHHNLGNVLIESGRLQEAISHYERALQLRSGDTTARRNLALLLLHLERPVEALPHLEELARTVPGDSDVAAALREARGALRR